MRSQKVQVQTVGVSTRYDGCHILVFDEATPPDTTELFKTLLLQHPEPNSHIPPARTHLVEGHETVAYSASPPRDRVSGHETPEDTLLIEAALSIRYWIASPRKNVLVVATTRKVLAETLRKVNDSDQTAFPVSLEEWDQIDSGMPTWGMRHLPEEPDPFDNTPFSDLRNKEEGYDVSGLTFGVDAEADKAVLTFIDCSPKMLVWVQGMIRREFSSLTSTTVGPDDSVLFHLDWSKETPDDDRKDGGRFVYWLLYNLGHAAVI